MRSARVELKQRLFAVGVLTLLLCACSRKSSEQPPQIDIDAAPDDARLGDTAPGDAGVTDGPQDMLVVDGLDRDTIPADGAPHDTAPPDASVSDAENLIIDLFERSDSFVVPDGVQLIRIQAWGAGGGGGEPNDERKAEEAPTER